MEGFSERLRHLIDKAGITPYEVSMKTGISQSTLSRLLNKATSKPNIKNVEILANYFCANKVWLLTGEGEMLSGSNAQTSEGNIGSGIVGNNVQGGGISQNGEGVMHKLLDMLREKDATIASKDAQIEHLLDIILKERARE